MKANDVKVRVQSKMAAGLVDRMDVCVERARPATTRSAWIEAAVERAVVQAEKRRGRRKVPA